MRTLALAIPDLRTARLVLRAPREADFPAMLGCNDSPRTGSVGGPLERRRNRRRLPAGIGHRAQRGDGPYPIDTRDGALAGRVGVIFRDGRPEPELARHVFDGFEVHGIATEAAQAAQADDHARVCPAPLMSMIDPRNARSVAVAQRLGAALEATVERPEGRHDVWRHRRPA
jgi:RimJ/RimL family protein N-acetyltransferase